VATGKFEIRYVQAIHAGRVECSTTSDQVRQQHEWMVQGVAAQYRRCTLCKVFTNITWTSEWCWNSNTPWTADRWIQ